MKARYSGMPSQTVWEGFFDPCRVLTQLDFTDPHADVVDFGCGYGTFSIAAAQATTGIVYALDIDPLMIAATSEKAHSLGLTNVKTIERDFIAHATGLPDQCVGYAMIFNILHAEKPLVLLREAFRTLRPGGKVAIIHWVHDAATPRGPDLSIRPRPEQCQSWLLQAGLELLIPFVPLPPYHYGLVGHRPH